MKLTAQFIWIPVSAFISFALPLFLLAGCGENNDAVADSSTISVNPSGITSTIADTTSYDLTATVRYADGTPYPKAVLYITGSFAQPRNATNTTPRYQFYYYPGGELNPSNLPVNSGFYAQTDDYGVYRFSITVYGTVGGATNSFSDTINLFSGTVFGSVTVGIN